jgi:predicted methyltransferase
MDQFDEKGLMNNLVYLRQTSKFLPEIFTVVTYSMKKQHEKKCEMCNGKTVTLQHGINVSVLQRQKLMRLCEKVMKIVFPKLKVKSLH